MSPQPFHLPWLRSVPGTTWDEETWPTAKTVLARAIAMRSRLAREGW